MGNSPQRAGFRNVSLLQIVRLVQVQQMASSRFVSQSMRPLGQSGRYGLSLVQSVTSDGLQALTAADCLLVIVPPQRAHAAPKATILLTNQYIGGGGGDSLRPYSQQRPMRTNLS